ncbi:RHS repeat-associated protein [Variovorax boronicumulans]|uniref:RHS repeat-associated core domain-containing protein n=1 Tax=Variovorax boronicumulans TaxID=436515 RepID=UPI00277E57B3|nr:RHS repeat-associated core domain-containing protein [Variovorax boronicumulans]MDQ0072466.1 RHS repeat-associated protein [Variovorax boronicumulans]
MAESADAGEYAIEPLERISASEVVEGFSPFDKWLRENTDGIVTLERLKTVGNAIPGVSNLIAFSDVVYDIIEINDLKQAGKEVSFISWVNLGVDAIGVIPMPGTGPARVALRAPLQLAKQKLKQGVKNLAEDFLILIAGHLANAIKGELEEFIQTAQKQLRAMLEECGKFAEKLANALADALLSALDGHLFNSNTSVRSANVALKAADRTSWWDPLEKSEHLLRAAKNMFVAGNKEAANMALGGASSVATYISPEFRTHIQSLAKAMRALGKLAAKKMLELVDPGTMFSIGWLLMKILEVAPKLKRKRGGTVHPRRVNNVKDKRGPGTLEPRRRQKRSTADGRPCKCPGSATARSISLSLGAETLTHTDFELPGALPITWSRTYRSDLAAYDLGVLGARWITPYTTQLDIELLDDGSEGAFLYHAEDGRTKRYPALAVGQTHRDVIEDLTLVRLSADLLTVNQGRDWMQTYERIPALDGQRGFFRLALMQMRAGPSVGLRYDHAHPLRPAHTVLSDVMVKQGAETIAHAGTRIDAAGRLTGVWEIKEGQLVRQLAAYSYDANGDLVEAQDENGPITAAVTREPVDEAQQQRTSAAWHYRYYHHLLTRYEDRTGRGVNLAYDGTAPSSRAVREWMDDGSFDTRVRWTEHIRLTTVTDALGHETRYYYDELGYTYRMVHPDLREEWFFRDEARNIVRHIQPNGGVEHFGYDAEGQLVSQTRPDGSEIHLDWDDSGNLVKILDPEGQVWLRAYDAQGNLVEETDPLGHKTKYEYDKAGLPVRVTDAKGGITRMAYNTVGQLLSRTDCSGKTTTWAYDPRGRLIQSTDAAGQSTHYRYARGQLEAIVNPDQSTERFAHDAEGRLIAHTDVLGRTTRYGYSEAGLIARRTDAAGRQLTYRWDKLGRLVQLDNENRSSYTFAYDPVGRLLAEVGFDGQKTGYAYAEFNGVLEKIEQPLQSIDMRFDAMGRLLERTAGEASETFGYDATGRLVAANNRDARLQWFYDAVGNPVREHLHYLHAERSASDKPMTAVWRHEYDELGNRIVSTRPDGHEVRLLTYGSGHVHGLMLDGQDILSFERDDLHREVAREQGNGLTQSLDYDPMGRLLEQRITSTAEATTAAPAAAATGNAGGVLVRRTYVYDKVGQLIGIGDTRRGRLDYRYDPVGRLVQANSALGREVFAFDPAGNIAAPGSPEAPGQSAATSRGTGLRDDPLPEARVPSPVAAHKLLDNLLKDYAGTTYRYDAQGNLVERVRNGERTTFEWDGFGRMVAAKSHQQGTTTFAYDALGRRVAKLSPKGRTVYGWDGDMLAYESVESVADSGKSVKALARTVHYLYEPGSFRPLLQARKQQAIALHATPDYAAMVAEEGDYDVARDPLWTTEPVAQPFAKDEICYCQCDHLGTPQELTDDEARIAWSAQYRAWGEAREVIGQAAESAGIRNPIRFQGQYLDEETGLHYNRHRYYDPHSGRFVSRDPIALYGGNNLHAYAPNPTGWTDPVGLKSGYQENWERLHGPLPAGYQVHHIIPKDGTTVALAKKLCPQFDVDDESNLIALPKDNTVAARSGPGFGKTLHNGYHAGYTYAIRGALKAADRLKIPKVSGCTKIKAIQAASSSQLKSGTLSMYAGKGGTTSGVQVNWMNSMREIIRGN